MKAAKRIINSFDFEEVCLLVTFMRSDSKERILKQLEEMQSDDKTIYQLRDSIKEKIEILTQEELNELLFDLPPNEFSDSQEKSDEEYSSNEE